MMTPKLDTDTLLVIPCSGAKRTGDKPGNGASILSYLESRRAAWLGAARSALRQSAKLDEATLMPAYLRYAGQLYEYGSSSIATAIAAGQRIVIVSGGYGLLLAEEPIGLYGRPFRRSDWPRSLLETSILEYVCRERIRSVIAILSATTGYAKFFKRVNWKSAGIAADLVSPVFDGGCAIDRVPRAQGEAIAALIENRLTPNWQSSNGLCLSIARE